MQVKTYLVRKWIFAEADVAMNAEYLRGIGQREEGEVKQICYDLLDVPDLSPAAQESCRPSP
jgi:hypothetical protein